MKKIHFLGLLLLTFIKRLSLQKLMIAVIVFFLGLIIITVISKNFLSLQTRLKISGHLSEGIIGIYHPDSLPPVVLGLLSEPLVKMDQNGQPMANLTENWQVNKDATVYSFKLKNNLYWNDQSKVQSSDLQFNIPDVLVTFPDNQTIQFNLADSFVPFPTLLTQPVLKKGSLVGLGKYAITQSETSKNMIIKMILKPVKEKAYPEIVIRFYPDDKTAKTAFQLGEIDSLLGLADDKELGSYSTISERKIVNYKKIVGIFYNTKDKILSDKNFRKALGLALPGVPLEENAKTSIAPFSWAFSANTKDSTNNKDLAKQYLDKVKMGKDSEITLVTTPLLNNLGEQVIKAWNSLGIKAVLRLEGGLPQDYQALLTSQTIPTDPDQYALWHSTQTKTNLSHYKSDRVDRDLEEGRKSLDIAIRKERYLDFQKILADDMPATFLYFPKYNIIYRKKVENNLNTVLTLQQPYIK